MKATKLIINGEEQELSQVYSVDGQIGNVTLTTKTFSISGLSDLTTAQSAYDFFSNGNNPLLKYNNKIYSLVSQEGGNLVFYSSDEADYYYLVLETSNGTVTDIIDDTGYFGDLYLEGLTVLSYGHSTWQDFLDAYDKDAIVYCKASSQSNPGTGNQTRMAFMAFVDINSTTGVIQGVEFQYYRSRSDHNSAANQLDEVYVYKLVPASGGTWTVTQRNTGAKAVAGTGISLGWGSGNMTISNTGVTSVNGDTGAVSVNDTKISSTAPSSPTEGMVWYDTTNDELKVYDGTNWNVTGKEYEAGVGIEISNTINGRQGPSPAGFHIPTQGDWAGVETIMDSLNLTSITQYSTALFLPCMGRRGTDGSLSGVGEEFAYYASTSACTSYSDTWGASCFVDGMLSDGCVERATGLPIRSFKDEYVAPDFSWTVEYGTLGGTGIFWNQSKGLISITDGTNGYTMMDKNLGATTVYNYGDTLTDANMGYYYQWGNNYGFPATGTLSNISTTKVDTSGYGPGNYYSSSTYIDTSGYEFPDTDWSIAQNNNLWGDITPEVVVPGGGVISNTGVLSVNGKTGDVTDFYVVDTLPNISQADMNATYYLSVGNDEYEEWIVVEKEAPLMTFSANSEQYIPYEVVFTEPTTLTFNSKTGSGYIQFSGDNIDIIYSDAGVVEVIGGGNEGWYYYDENLLEYVYADATSYTFPAGTYHTMYEESYVTGYDTITFSTGATTIREWAKVGTVTNTKTFYLSSTSDLTTAQAAYDWYNAGKNPIIVYNNDVYVCKGRGLPTQLAFWSATGTISNNGYEIPIIYLKVVMDMVSHINLGTEAIPTGIQNDTTGTTTTVTKIRAGTEAEYNALSTHDTSTIYHIY